jgi:hypothetical protein
VAEMAGIRKVIGLELFRLAAVLKQKLTSFYRRERLV